MVSRLLIHLARGHSSSRMTATSFLFRTSSTRHVLGSCVETAAATAASAFNSVTPPTPYASSTPSITLARRWHASSPSDPSSRPDSSDESSGNHSGVWRELRSWARFLLPTTRYEAVYYPSAPPVVEAMMELARVGRGDVVYDVGCGDGRILVAAAQRGAARCVGIELDGDLAARARANAAAAGFGPPRVEVVEGDARGADLSPATVVALYLSARGNRELLSSSSSASGDDGAGSSGSGRPGRALRPGARVVSHYFPVEGWEGRLRARDVSAGVELYLYVVPGGGGRREENRGRGKRKGGVLKTAE